MTLTFARSRIGRGFYWLALLALTSMTLNFVMLTVIIAYIPSPLVLLFVVGIIGTYCQLVVCAARCRDIGRPGTRAFMTLIPVIGIFVVCWLGIVKSVPDAD